MTRALACLVAIFLAAPAAAQNTWQGQTAAFFGVTFIDTSLEGQLNGPRDDEAARLAMVEADLAQTLVAEGLVLVDLAPVAAELERIANPADCSGCAVRLATRLKARYAVVSEVQKVSNLILAMNVEVRDAASGARVRGLAVEIRGNTDEGWRRAMRYILIHGIFTP